VRGNEQGKKGRRGGRRKEVKEKEKEVEKNEGKKEVGRESVQPGSFHDVPSNSFSLMQVQLFLNWKNKTK
jgi:hypothetical protein